MCGYMSKNVLARTAGLAYRPSFPRLCKKEVGVALS